MASKYELIVGIDVGKEGGIAVLDVASEQILVTHKTPDGIKGHFDVVETIISGANGRKILVVIERVTGRYGDSAHSAFSFGFTAGIMHTVVERLGLPYELAHPKTWMKEYEMAKKSGEKDTVWKNRLKALAMKMYPEYDGITLWNSDAILIAKYGDIKYNGK